MEPSGYSDSFFTVPKGAVVSGYVFLHLALWAFLFLDRMHMALLASGLWLRYATLQNLILAFPWIAPPTLYSGALKGKEGF